MGMFVMPRTATVSQKAGVVRNDTGGVRGGGPPVGPRGGARGKGKRR